MKAAQIRMGMVDLQEVVKQLRPMELDLEATFKQMESDVIRMMLETVKNGGRPWDAINAAIAGLDGQEPVRQVQKAKAKIGTVSSVKGKLWHKISDDKPNWADNWELLGDAPAGWKQGDPIPENLKAKNDKAKHDEEKPGEESQQAKPKTLDEWAQQDKPSLINAIIDAMGGDAMPEETKAEWHKYYQDTDPYVLANVATKYKITPDDFEKHAGTGAPEIKEPEPKKPEKPAKAPASAAITAPGKAPAMPSYDVVQELGGNTGAKLINYVDPETGESVQGVLKAGAAPGQSVDEYYANKIYTAIGAPVPKAQLFNENGQPVLVNRYLKNAVAYSSCTAKEKMMCRQYACEHFVADAFLANWDVTGADMDNIMWDTGTHTPIRIDSGGALRYRAQGSKKGQFFSDQVPELETMRDPTKLAGKMLFSAVTDQMVKDQIAALLQTAPAVIATLPDPALRIKLKKRLNYLEHWVPESEKQAQAGKMTPAKLGQVVNSQPPHGMPPVHMAHRQAFNWYQGSGYGTGNSTLRNYDELTPENKDHVAAMDDYFSKTPERKLSDVHKGGTFRGQGPGVLKKLFNGMNFPDVQAFKVTDLDQKGKSGITLKQLMDKTLVGSVFFDQGFTSTSTSQATAQGFMKAHKQAINGSTYYLSKDGVPSIMRLNGTARAVYVNGVSGSGMAESEWLLPRGQAYKIEKVEFKENGNGLYAMIDVSVMEGF